MGTGFDGIGCCLRDMDVGTVFWRTTQRKMVSGFTMRLVVSDTEPVRPVVCRGVAYGKCLSGRPRCSAVVSSGISRQGGGGICQGRRYFILGVIADLRCYFIVRRTGSKAFLDDTPMALAEFRIGTGAADTNGCWVTANTEKKDKLGMERHRCICNDRVFVDDWELVAVYFPTNGMAFLSGG